jgi:UDP-GlcNAc:undecaprenyl-phosphate/decaprenyl-phosphate GlcNAc-1-phosphate transferase
MTLATVSLLKHGLLFISALVTTVALTPVAIKLAGMTGFLDHPAPTKFHRKPTPYLGGLAVAVAVLGGLVAILVRVPELRWQFAAIAVGGVLVSVIGLIDDRRILGPRPRIAVQIIGGSALWAGGVRVAPSHVIPLDFAITVFVVLAITNAVNLLDNMDGLSSGTVAIVSLAFFVAAYWQGQQLVSAMAIMLAGACIGFLPYNFNPARIFLGDAGTLFLGFLLATLAMKLRLEGYPVVTRISAPMFILAVPLFDMTLVVISRLRAGRPVFLGGTDHSSHRLVALGATTRQAALITYGVSAISGGIGLELLAVASPALTWVALGGGAVTGIVLLWTLEAVPIQAVGGRRAKLTTPAPITPKGAPPDILKGISGGGK